MTINNDPGKRRALYDILVKPGADGKPYYSKSFEQFETQFSNPSSQENLYNSMIEDGLLDTKRTSKDSFMAAFSDLEKKNLSPNESGIGLQVSSPSPDALIVEDEFSDEVQKNTAEIIKESVFKDTYNSLTGKSPQITDRSFYKTDVVTKESILQRGDWEKDAATIAYDKLPEEEKKRLKLKGFTESNMNEPIAPKRPVWQLSEQEDAWFKEQESKAVPQKTKKEYIFDVSNIQADNQKLEKAITEIDSSLVKKYGKDYDLNLSYDMARIQSLMAEQEQSVILNQPFEKVVELQGLIAKVKTIVEDKDFNDYQNVATAINANNKKLADIQKDGGYHNVREIISIQENIQRDVDAKSRNAGTKGSAYAGITPYIMRSTGNLIGSIGAVWDIGEGIIGDKKVGTADVLQEYLKSFTEEAANRFPAPSNLNRPFLTMTKLVKSPDGTISQIDYDKGEIMTVRDEAGYIREPISASKVIEALPESEIMDEGNQVNYRAGSHAAGQAIVDLIPLALTTKGIAGGMEKAMTLTMGEAKTLTGLATRSNIASKTGLIGAVTGQMAQPLYEEAIKVYGDTEEGRRNASLFALVTGVGTGAISTLFGVEERLATGQKGFLDKFMRSRAFSETKARIAAGGGTWQDFSIEFLKGAASSGFGEFIEEGVLENALKVGTAHFFNQFNEKKLDTNLSYYDVINDGSVGFAAGFMGTALSPNTQLNEIMQNSYYVAATNPEKFSGVLNAMAQAGELKMPAGTKISQVEYAEKIIEQVKKLGAQMELVADPYEAIPDLLKLNELRQRQEGFEKIGSKAAAKDVKEEADALELKIFKKQDATPEATEETLTTEEQPTQEPTPETLTTEEQAIVNDQNIPIEDGRAAKKSSRKRQQRSESVVAAIEAEAETLTDGNRAAELLATVEGATDALLSNAPVSTFEERHGVSMQTLANADNIEKAYEEATGTIPPENLKAELVAELANEGIKLKKPIEVEGVVPLKPQKAKKVSGTGIKSLAGVVSNKNTASQVHTSVMVDEENMVATDGAQMVVLKNDGTEPGFYTPKGEKTEGKALDYKPLLAPPTTKSDAVPIDDLIETANGAANTAKNVSNVLVTPVQVNGFVESVDPAILLKNLQALKANGAKTVTVGMTEGKRHLTIEADNGNTGVVMPRIGEFRAHTEPITLNSKPESTDKKYAGNTEELVNVSSEEEVLDKYGDTLGSIEDVDENRIAQLRTELKMPTTGMQATIIPVDMEKIGKYVELSYLYIKKGVKSAAELAKKLGSPLTAFIQNLFRAGVRMQIHLDPDNFNNDFHWLDYTMRGLQDKTRMVKVTQAELQKLGLTDADPHGLMQLQRSKAEDAYNRVFEKVVGRAEGKFGAKAVNKNSLMGRVAAMKGISIDEAIEFAGTYFYMLHAKERNQRVREIVGKRSAAAIAHLESKIEEELNKESPHQPTITRWENKIAELRIIPSQGSGYSDKEVDEFFAKEAINFLNKKLKEENAKSKKNKAEINKINQRLTEIQEFLNNPYDSNVGYSIFKDDQSPEMEAIFREFQAAVTHEYAKVLYEGGLIDEKTKDNLINGEREGFTKFENYVPLAVRSDSLEDFVPMNTAEIEGNSAPLKSIIGTDKYTADKRINPLQKALTDLHRAYHRAEMNKVRQEVAKMVDNSINAKNWRIVKSKNIPGRVNSLGEVVSFDDMTDSRVVANSIPFQKNGQRYYIFIAPILAGDKPVRHPILEVFDKNPMGYDKFTASVLKLFSGYNQVMRTILTMINPEFALTNPLRDGADVLFNAAKVSEELGLGSLKRRIVLKTPAALATLMRHPWMQVPSTQMDKDLIEARAHGLGMSWGNYEGVEKEIGKISVSRGKGMQALNTTWDSLNFAGNVTEMMMRLATFSALREQGVSADKAAMAAKNISINFETKGKYSSWINIPYLFANAGIQGAYNTYKTVTSKRGVGLFSLAVAGYGLNRAVLKAVLDDDDYGYLINDYVRVQNNALVYNPFNKRSPLTIAKPYSLLRLAASMGEGMVDLYSGYKSVPDVAADVFMNGMTVFDPLGGVSGNLMSAGAPTILKPYVEVYTNISWGGDQIRHFDYGNTNKFTQYNASTDQSYVDFAEGLYHKTGLDFSPTNLEYVVNQYWTGFPKFVTRVAGAIQMIRDGEFDTTKVPIVRRFYVNRNDRNEAAMVLFNILDRKVDREFTEKQMRLGVSAVIKLAEGGNFTPEQFDRYSGEVMEKLFTDIEMRNDIQKIKNELRKELRDARKRIY